MSVVRCPTTIPTIGFLMMLKLGFSRCDDNQAVFFRRVGRKIIRIALFSFRLHHRSNRDQVDRSFQSRDHQHVEITDLDELHWLLGIEIRRDREKCTIHLSQHSCRLPSVVCLLTNTEVRFVAYFMSTLRTQCVLGSYLSLGELISSFGYSQTLSYLSLVRPRSPALQYSLPSRDLTRIQRSGRGRCLVSVHDGNL